MQAILDKQQAIGIPTVGCQSAYNKDRLANGLTALSFAIPVERFASLGFKVFEGKIASKATQAANEANAAKKAKEIAQGPDGEMAGSKSTTIQERITSRKTSIEYVPNGGEVFLGYGYGASLPATKKASFGASLRSGNINQLSPLEKAQLGKAVSDAIKGPSGDVGICGYFICIGANQSPNSVENHIKQLGKTSFEVGVGVGAKFSGSFGNSKMIPIGTIKR